MAMTLVSTTTVGSGGAASIEFTNIPQTGKDLLVKLSLRGTSQANIFVRVNNDSGSNYSRRQLQGSGASVSTTDSTGATYWNTGFQSKDTDTANTFGSMELYLSNYTSSANKSGSVDSVNENNATTAYQHILALSWGQTTAISSIQIYNFDTSTFVQHSTASLYIVS